MRYFLFFIICLFLFFSASHAQINSRSNVPLKDSLVQLFGIVMTSDSLRGLPATSVIVEGTGRGTIANTEGIFSIVVNKGDKVRFSCIGYKDVTVIIPHDIHSNQYSVLQLMTEDTIYLPATVIRARPTEAQFEREFLSLNIPNDAEEIARLNNDYAKRRALMQSMPNDSREAFNAQMRKQTVQYYSRGQLPPMNILSPLAWTDFVQAWKRGDFRSNSN